MICGDRQCTESAGGIDVDCPGRQSSCGRQAYFPSRFYRCTTGDKQSFGVRTQSTDCDLSTSDVDDCPTAGPAEGACVIPACPAIQRANQADDIALQPQQSVIRVHGQPRTRRDVDILSCLRQQRPGGFDSHRADGDTSVHIRLCPAKVQLTIGGDRPRRIRTTLTACEVGQYRRLGRGQQHGSGHVERSGKLQELIGQQLYFGVAGGHRRARCCQCAGEIDVFCGQTETGCTAKDPRALRDADATGCVDLQIEGCQPVADRTGNGDVRCCRQPEQVTSIDATSGRQSQAAVFRGEQCIAAGTNA